MPWSTRPIDVPEIVVARVHVDAVVPPAIRPPRIRASGLEERTASSVTPSARRSCRTTRAVPGPATTPSWPPESVSRVAVTPAAPRSTRTPVRER